MARTLAIVAGLLLTGSPALAAEGTYKSKGEYLAGDLTFCYGDPKPLLTVILEGMSARGVLVTGVAHLRVAHATGALASDGTLKLTFALAPDPYNAGTIKWEGSLVDDRLVGISQSNRCRFRWTLTKDGI
jgi:hypothetical protein